MRYHKYSLNANVTICVLKYFIDSLVVRCAAKRNRDMT
jgi:hypothetical protein